MSLEAWDRLAPHFGPGGEGVEDNEELWPALQVALRRLLPPPARVLDLGCGAGLLTARLAAEGYETLGLDPSPEMIALARKQETRAGFREGGSGSLGPGETFDGVVSSMVLPFVAAIDEEAGRIQRLLAPGGVLLISDFHPDFVACELARGSEFFCRDSQGVAMPYRGERLPLQARGAASYERMFTNRGFVKLLEAGVVFSGDASRAEASGDPPAPRFLLLAFRKGLEFPEVGFA